MSGYQFVPALWPALGSAIFVGAIAVYVWRRRGETRGALPLAMLGFLVVAWCLCAAAEVAAIGFDEQRLWFVVRDALTLPGVVLGLWFALEYAGLERWLTRPVTAALTVMVILYVTLDLVDDGRLLWSSIVWDGEIQGDRTPLGLAFAAFAIAMFLLATAVFVVLFIRSPAHRAPVALILLGQLALRILYPLVVFDIAYVPNIVAGVVGFDIIAAMYAIALFRFRLFDLVPIARQTILARMPDALLVLDDGDRIADVNEAALRLLELERGSIRRAPVSTALAAQPDLVRCITESEPASAEASFETAIGIRTCEVSSTPLADWQGRPIGRLVLLHDISALRQVEQQLVDRERALAAAEERERLARELHDGLAQDLWLAKLKSTRLAALPDLAPEARALTDEITAAVDAGIAEAREAVATMRLGDEGQGSLRELLSRTLADFEDRFGLAVEFECESELATPPPRALAETLRITQEALTNVRRHADATVVRVRGAVDDRVLVLEVRDNGCGFDPDAVGATAYGIAGMRERAGLIGGELQVESAQHKGTRVTLRVPLPTSVPSDAPVAVS